MLFYFRLTTSRGTRRLCRADNIHSLAGAAVRDLSHSCLERWRNSCMFKLLEVNITIIHHLKVLNYLYLTFFSCRRRFWEATVIWKGKDQYSCLSRWSTSSTFPTSSSGPGYLWQSRRFYWIVATSFKWNDYGATSAEYGVAAADSNRSTELCITRCCYASQLRAKC